MHVVLHMYCVHVLYVHVHVHVRACNYDILVQLCIHSGGVFTSTTAEYRELHAYGPILSTSHIVNVNPPCVKKAVHVYIKRRKAPQSIHASPGLIICMYLIYVAKELKA